MPATTPQPGPSSEPPSPGSGRSSGLVAPRDRWWWTGAYRGVLGAIVVAFQAPEIMSGNASVANWLVGALGAAAAVWGAILVAQAYRDLGSSPGTDQG